MIRHVVLMELAEDAGPGAAAAIVAGIEALPADIAEIVSLSAGVDAGVAAGNADVVAVVDFARAEDYLAYAGHPAHQKLLAETIRPVLARRTAIQYEIPDR